MRFIFSNIIPDKVDLNQCGGKGANLFNIIDAGLSVPEFVIISSVSLLELIPAGIENPKQFIDDFHFQPNTFDEIIKYIYNDGNAFAAVRSSGVDEDGGTHSFAGQYETELFVTKEHLESAIKKVWLSAFESRVIEYRKANDIHSETGIAVIVQKMVDAEVSGVAFGLNPVNGRRDQYLVSSVYGLGEGLVSGELDADTFTINRDGNIIEEIIVNKAEQIRSAGHGGTSLIVVEAHLQNIASLNTSMLKSVATAILKLHSKLHYYPDIEFSFYQNKLFVLQVRPVTSVSNLPDPNTKKTTWDNSNIIESYPGLTSPLTFSFITKMYEAVYRQFSVVMGIDLKKVNANSAIYANMLGLIKGRIYYNLNSWFASLQLLPGYSVNAGFMEKMMGVKESFDSGLIIENKGWRDYYDILKAIWRILINLNRADKMRAQFQEYFNGVMLKYNAMDLSVFSIDQLIKVYLEFEDTLVKKWKAPLVNDF
ncbi:MAG: phosphoenolpyruvate synthase, partial [Bacteroidia bacterium]|nr:phosphoenolpyruvate synthase [Bacteroidia bacterium]